MTRRESREQAFLLLFEQCFHDEEMPGIIESAKAARDLADDPFCHMLAQGAGEHAAELDTLFERHLTGWRIDRISKPALAILRLACYEMRYVAEVPVSVSINEAVELAKKFGADDDAAFVNGILGRVSKELSAQSEDESETGTQEEVIP